MSEYLSDTYSGPIGTRGLLAASHVHGDGDASNAEWLRYALDGDRAAFQRALAEVRDVENRAPSFAGGREPVRTGGNNRATWNPMRPEPPNEAIERYRQIREIRVSEDRERAYAELREQFPDVGSLDQFDRLHNNLARLAEQLGARPEDVLAVMRFRLRELFADKDIAIRVGPDGLAGVLERGRFGTAIDFEHPESNVVRSRIKLHENLFGYDPDSYPPELRPVSGYLRILGEQPVGVHGSNDALARYGDIQVVLKSEVAERATACVGDAVTDQGFTRPSPLLDPSGWSYGIVPHGAAEATSQYGLGRAPYGCLAGIDRDYGSADFLANRYVEVQVHGGVQVSDIDHVIFPGAPSDELIEALSSAREGGVPWKVLPRDPIEA